MTLAEENALKIEVEKLKKQHEIIKKLITVDGFFEMYFEECKKQKYRQEAFEFVNELHLQLLGKEKYKSFEYFKQVQTRYYQNKRKQ